MIVAIIITLTIIVLVIGVFSIIKTSEVTKSPQYLKLKNKIKAFIYKKIQEHEYRKIQKQEEAERLEQERIQREQQEKERLERQRKKRERQLAEQKRREAILMEQDFKRREAFEKRAREIELQMQIEDTVNRTNKILNDISNSENQKKPKSTRENYKNKDFRKDYPADIRCIDGRYVRSKAEKRIADFCYYNRITYIYEQEYWSSIKQKPYCPDFYFPDYNLYIEFFGKTDEKYLQKKNEKIEAFTSDININFEYIDHKDYNKIENKLKEICKKYNIPLKGEKQ